MQCSWRFTAMNARPQPGRLHVRSLSPTSVRHEGLNPGRRVPEDAAQAVDDVLQLLLLVRLEEPCPLERAESRPDSDGLQVVDQRLAVAGRAGIAPEIPRVKPARVTRFREQPLGRA